MKSHLNQLRLKGFEHCSVWRAESAVSQIELVEEGNLHRHPRSGGGPARTETDQLVALVVTAATTSALGMLEAVIATVGPAVAEEASDERGPKTPWGQVIA